MKINVPLFRLAAAGFIAMTCLPVAMAQETGDLKITFKYGGEAPARAAINATADADFCGKHGLESMGLIVGEDNALANVVVYVYTGRGGSDIDFEGDPANHVLANLNCQFEPHIVLAKAGDTLEVTNPDPVGHNANMQFLNNRAQNLAIPAGKSISVDLKEDEPAPIPVDCNIHPWMKAFVVVLEHPFAGVSDEKGELLIKGLPVGEELVFRAFHESARISEVEINGKKEDWRRSRFEVEIKPGLNDMGTVVLGEDLFD